MAEQKSKCLICGKKPTYKITLPHGTIFICHKCAELLTFKINDASPILWLDPDYLYDEAYDDEGAMTKEEKDQLTPEDYITLAKDTADALCNDDYFHSQMQDCIKIAVEQWRENKERKLIENAPLKELPLFINSIKYPYNKELLEKRLKGEK